MDSGSALHEENKGEEKIPSGCVLLSIVDSFGRKVPVVIDESDLSRPFCQVHSTICTLLQLDKASTLIRIQGQVIPPSNKDTLLSHGFSVGKENTIGVSDIDDYVNYWGSSNIYDPDSLPPIDCSIWCEICDKGLEESEVVIIKGESFCPHCELWAVTSKKEKKKKRELAKRVSTCLKSLKRISFGGQRKWDRHDTAIWLNWVGNNILGNMGDDEKTLDALIEQTKGNHPPTTHPSVFSAITTLSADLLDNLKNTSCSICMNHLSSDPNKPEEPVVEIYDPFAPENPKSGVLGSYNSTKSNQKKESFSLSRAKNTSSPIVKTYEPLKEQQTQKEKNVAKKELEEKQVKRLPCGHVFHKACLWVWLKRSFKCPLCRFELPTDDPEFEYRKKIRDDDDEKEVVSTTF